MATISVVIPVYNSEKFIEACVASLQRQSFTDWEAVLVDDGSKDQSLVICNALAAQDSRIRVVHQQNQGVSAARNTGIRHATGERVLFLDSDDALDPETFSQIQPYIAEDYDVICWSLRTDAPVPQYCSMSDDLTIAREGDEKALYDLRLRAFSGWSLEHKKDNSMYFVVTKLIRRDLILEKDIWFDTKLKHGEDTLFTMRVMEEMRSAIAVNRYFYIRTEHPGSATVSFCPNSHRGNIHLLEEYRNVIDRKHPGENKYEIAFVKHQLASLCRCLRQDIMHPGAPYTTTQRYKMIRDLLCVDTYLPRISTFQPGFKWTHRILHMIIRLKLVPVLYLCAKIGIV